MGKVKGAVTGAILGSGAMTSGLSASTTQRIETVESGGSTVGTIVGGKESPVGIAAGIYTANGVVIAGDDGVVGSVAADVDAAFAYSGDDLGR